MITAATILLPVAPASVHVMFLSCVSFEDILRVLAAAKSHLGEVLSAFEFLDAASMQAARENLGHKSPLGADAPFYVLVETHGSSTAHDRAKVDGLLTHLLESSLVTDGTVAQDAKQAAAIWELRESLGVALRKDGIVYKFTVAAAFPIHAWIAGTTFRFRTRTSTRSSRKRAVGLRDLPRAARLGATSATATCISTCRCRSTTRASWRCLSRSCTSLRRALAAASPPNTAWVSSKQASSASARPPLPWL